MCKLIISFKDEYSPTALLKMEGRKEAAVVMENNKQIIFKGYIDRAPEITDMELKISNVSTSKLITTMEDGDILVTNLYLSCDPYMRGRMRDFHASYIPPFTPQSVMEGFGVSRVLHSKNQNFKAGDVVTGLTGWEEYSVIHNTAQLRKIQQDDDDESVPIPLSYHVGLLGMPGFTAYAGFYEVCAPKKGDSVYVSAASGAVGQIVGQLAKLHGCYVVGSAGTSQKVELLKNKLGYDNAFNYKTEPDLDASLKRYFPHGIDIYFENVGGPMLDAVLLNMAIHGRVVVCGMVSQHGMSSRHGIHNLYTLISKRIRMQGFLQSDYLSLFPRFLEDVTSYYRQGKIVYIENMNEGLESAPAAFVGLFSGENVGKQVVRLAGE
ncbi:2-alkenal reductase (NADP(+)-dependent) [Heracleum sosnowskyi]|uniref:2-alkenal reductase (NADP(+)-dependent) n=1 Tax=Heracleum sosnowskyi TaxID=360622 RepID=A0AAD8M1S2_9APIA|nr:2-alkenal reductase (NADP(+)-dependent) [Heracleum sosnowskyi]